MKYAIESVEQFLKLPGESVIEINKKDYLIESPAVSFKKIGEDNLRSLIENKLVFILEHYYLPYSGKLKLSDNDYTDQKRFKYTPNKEIDFKRWSQLVKDVYHNNGVLMQAYFIMSIFRDVIYDGNNFYTPLLNMFGPPQQGKSTAARSMGRMFGARFGEEEGINLNTDTSSGIMQYVNKFQNTIIWVNELSRNLKKEREVKIEMLKTYAGGSERKTRATSTYKANKEKNRNGTIISGQDSPNFDPGLNDRVIPLKFDGKHRNPDKFDELKHLENKGYCTQVTVDLLQYRKLIESYYYKYSKKAKNHIIISLKALIKEGKLDAMPDDRIILNMISLAAPIEILYEFTELEFAFTLEEFYQLALDNIIYKSKIKATTNEVAQFFSVIDAADLREGEHWKLQKEKDGKVKLFLRIRKIMPFYRQAASRQQMSPFGESDIKDMLLMHRACQNDDVIDPKYNLGIRNNVDFPESNIKNTTAIVLDYDILRSEGVELSSKNGFVDDFEAQDDETLTNTVRELAAQASQHKNGLNGHAKEYVFNMLLDEPLASGNPLAITDLLELFNRKHNSNMDTVTFMGYCMEFIQQEKSRKSKIENGCLMIEKAY